MDGLVCAVPSPYTRVGTVWLPPFVDIEQQPDAAQIVESANGGNQTVPTLVYADGTAQTNPSLAQVKAKLAQLN